MDARVSTNNKDDEDESIEEQEFAPEQLTNFELYQQMNPIVNG